MKQLKLEVQVQREKLEFKKEQFYVKEKRGTQREGKYKRSSNNERSVGRFMKTRRQAEFAN